MYMLLAQSVSDNLYYYPHTSKMAKQSIVYIGICVCVFLHKN